MLRLNLSNKPRRLEFGDGFALILKPCTSAVMADARRDPLVVASMPQMQEQSDPEAAAAEFASFAGEVQDSVGIAMAKAVARRCVIGWEGVGDEDGRPIKTPTPEGIDALMDLPVVFDRFQVKFMAPAMLLVSEKNASSPALNGTSAGARTTARPARGGAKTARTSKTRR